MTVRIDVLPDGSFRPAAYSPLTHAAIKGFPGVRWDRETRTYVARNPRSRHGLETARRMLAGLGGGREVIWRGEEQVPPKPHASAPGAAFLAPFALRPYQAEGATWIVQTCLAHGCALLADDMGLGKTAQAIRAAEALRAGGQAGVRRVLVICPAIAALHWARNEIPKWRIDERTMASIATTKKSELIFDSAADYVIVSYDLFRRHSEKILGRFAVVILDEAHYLANSRAKRTQAVRQWVDLQERRPHLIALTGTPLDARVRDLHSLLDTLEPQAWGTFWEFTRRYCAGHDEVLEHIGRVVWRSDGVSNLDELHARLKHIMLRRSKSEVRGLPPKVRTLMPIELSVAARSQAAKAARNLEGLAAVRAALEASEGAKEKAAAELVTELREAGRNPLVFTTRIDVAERLGKTLGVPVATGNVGAEKRLALIAEASCAVATIYALPVGVSLVQFDCVVFVGLDWRPGVILQAEARPHRIGQERTVDVFYLVALGTADEIIQAKVIERLDTFATVVGNADDAEGLRDGLSGGTDDELLSALVAAVKGDTGT